MRTLIYHKEPYWDLHFLLLISFTDNELDGSSLVTYAADAVTIFFGDTWTEVEKRT